MTDITSWFVALLVGCALVALLLLFQSQFIYFPLRYSTEKDWTADALSVLGHSLGGAVALQFAARHSVRKIVVVSTFTTMNEMVRKQIGITLGPLLRHRFDNMTSLETILSQNRVPEIAIIHGQSDNIIPLRMGTALAQLNPIRIKFAPIPTAVHNNILQHPLPLILQTMESPAWCWRFSD